MAQLFGIILLIGFAMFAFQVALLLIFLIGLVFRPKETIGLIIILAAFWLFRVYPVASLALLVVVGLWAFVRNGRKHNAAIKAEKPTEPPPDPKLLK